MCPFDVPGTWVADARGQDRAVRVSAHVEAGFLVVSTWKSRVCVGTVRLLPAEAAELIGALATAMATLTDDDTQRLGPALDGVSGPQQPEPA